MDQLRAATWATVLDTVVNVDSIKYIQPIFCDDFNTPDVSSYAKRGICSFVVVLGGGDYTIKPTAGDGYTVNHSAKEKLTFQAWYGVTPGSPEMKIAPAQETFKTKADAVQYLKGIKDDLQK